MANIALILAGGVGSRMGYSIPKQFLKLCGKPVILYSLQAFQEHSKIDSIYIVVSNDFLKYIPQEQLAFYGITKLKGIITGGSTRKDSSYCGISEIAKTASPDDIVLIHDAARPMLSQQIITDNINAASIHGACATAIAVTDTIYQSDDGLQITKIPKRSVYYSAQTPQSFKLSALLSVHKMGLNDDVTDDAGLFVNAGLPVFMVNGDRKNIKITTKEDIPLLEGIINSEEG